MDWELENDNLRLQDMIIVYEQEIKTLEQENQQLKEKIELLEFKLDMHTKDSEEDQQWYSSRMSSALLSAC